MKTKRYDGADLRRVLTAMIVDQVVCSRITSQWTPEGLFDVDWANWIARWCVDHFKKYNSPPNGQLTGIFQSWANETVVADEVIIAIEKFLQSLSDEHQHEEEACSDYLLDLAGRYFNKVRMEKEMAFAELELDQGKIEEAQIRLAKMRWVELGLGSFVEPLNDLGIWEKAFNEERKKSLVTYPGIVGKFFGDSFQRGTLFSWMASEKCGKTSYLVDFAYKAVRNRNRVAFFEVGDGDQNEVMRNIAMRASGLPEYEGEYEIPKSWDDNGDLVSAKSKLEAVDYIEGYQKFKKICKNPNSFRVSCHPSSSISVEGIDSILEDWERENFLPDVLIIDYVDILAPPSGFKDKLDQIDETWKQLRRLSQQRHCLVMTATQAKASAYKKTKGFLGPEDFSGRKTKLGHVNGMIGINVSEDERNKQMGRLNWVVRRKMRNRNRKNWVTVAGCFDIGNPVMESK